jgi:hypothetical protein
MKARNLIIMLAIGLASFTSSSAATSETLIGSTNHAVTGIRPASIPRFLLLKKIRNNRKHIKRNRQKTTRVIVVRRGR